MVGDEVGYKKPPKHTQFKKGQSGNPKGRPRQQEAYGIGEALLKALDYSVPLHEDGQIRRVTAREAIVLIMLNEATKGEERAAKDLLLLLNVPGDQQGDVYLFNLNWGIPAFPPDAEEEAK